MDCVDINDAFTNAKVWINRDPMLAAVYRYD